jgi:indole-3-glycerol phosphate synthase
MADQNLIPQAEIVIAARRQALMERKSKTPIEAVRALASMQKRPQPILNSVSQDVPILFIGQIKYSATKLEIQNESYDPVATALRYAKNGFDAVALFTDEALYEGGLDDLVLISRAINLPVISQDYILDEYQIVEARAAGASALILSSAILEQTSMRALVSSTQRNRMTAIVEVCTPGELEYALSLSPYVIGITNRNPITGEIMSEQISQLRELIPPNIRVMLTDGLGSPEEMAVAAELKVDAVLITETILDGTHQIENLKSIMRTSHSNDQASL